MAGYHSVPQQSPTTWDPVYETYPTGSMMSNMPNYAQSPYIPHVSMAPQPTPALAKPHSNGIAHQRYHHLQHNVSGQGWTDGEDQLLVEAKKKGLQWNAISEQYFTGKSGNACRKRHERILQRSRAEWPEDKLERLATTYMSMREQIWTRIADELGESRWERVENMVLEQGLKTLKTKAQARHRRHSIHSRGYSSSGSSNFRLSGDYDRASVQEEFNDSGLGVGVGSDGMRDTRRGSHSMPAPPTILDNAILRVRDTYG